MKFKIVSSLPAPGQNLPVTDLMIYFSYILKVKLVICDLYNKNEFYWMINRVQG